MASRRLVVSEVLWYFFDNKIFGPKITTNLMNFDISIGGNIINRVHLIKFLGVTMSSDLSWKLNIGHLNGNSLAKKYIFVADSISEKVGIMGDINIHLEHQTEAHAIQLSTMFGYLQHVQTPRHNKGGLLDIIITRFEFRVHNIIVDPPIISDHSLIYGSLDIELPKSTKKLEMVDRRTRDHADLIRQRSESLKKHKLFAAKEQGYWESLIASNSGNSKVLWSIVSSLMGKKNRRVR
ncbi:hypothetical protein HELRODRAFT_160343 [Helobdella robusta]|uniref:Endonuclease/exonuclease/phosphatase domain-containing protein n=1 Tax=Helobdella robusta TaxID=6412 RepID=T1EQ43_HELRO|nr:hypothetical protein HELRODRAFT_160343 [Helobdella robusta]ESO06189.1 hypothetical protein HELRODRAFT_160343 [Helobdella robusta]